MRLSLLLPFVLVVAAAADCAKDYTCCSQFDFFIPVMPNCVENEPSGADNCKRNNQGKVPFWARLETSEWRFKGVCTDATPVVTRAELEEKEKKAKEFQEKFDEYCVKNKANCSSTETCYYNKTHIDGSTTSWSGTVTDMGAACVCQFSTGEYARANIDGTGACVLCEQGPNGTQPFVQRPKGNPEGPGAASFHNGEFACAYGPKKSRDSTTIQI
jgi:hypothetical protein